MHLNYTELSTNYKKNLDDKLRGFSGGPGFLETWTDDEDPKRAIMDIIDLAINAGHEVVAISAPDVAESFPLGGYKTGFINYEGNGVITYMSQNAMEILLDVQEILHDIKQDTPVKIAGLKDGILILDYEDKPGSRPVHYDLIRLEDYLNERLPSKVNIQTLNVEDKNKRKCRT